MTQPPDLGGHRGGADRAHQSAGPSGDGLLGLGRGRADGGGGAVVRAGGVGVGGGGADQGGGGVAHLVEQRDGGHRTVGVSGEAAEESIGGIVGGRGGRLASTDDGHHGLHLRRHLVELGPGTAEGDGQRSYRHPIGDGVGPGAEIGRRADDRSFVADGALTGVGVDGVLTGAGVGAGVGRRPGCG